MKFRFCGDGDCPDWVLLEIHSTLSVLSSIKIRTLAKVVVQSILDDEFPDEKLNEISSLKSGISCIRYLLINAAKYNTDEATFGAELQQLGLPKENSLSLCRILSENLVKLRQKLYESRLQVNVLESVSSCIPNNTIGCIQLNIKIKNEIVDGKPTAVSHLVNIHKSDLRVLLCELKTIKHIMENLDFEGKYNNSDVKKI